MTQPRKTKNAFLFMWSKYGLESCMAISKYEIMDQKNLINILKGEKNSV